MGNGIFVVSLDYELMWGAIFNKAVEAGYRYRTPYVNIIIPKLLDLFTKYGIHATWATVGGIACANQQEALEHSANDICNPYEEESLKEFIGKIDSKDNDLYFAKNTVIKISRIANQEIASHTFSHFYYLEHKEPSDKLAKELLASKEVLTKVIGEKVSTLVLPKNQIVDEIFPIMKNCGMNILRGKQITKRFNKHNLLSRAIHFLDAYIPLCGKSTYALKDVLSFEIYNIRASRFWRTYYKKLSIFEGLKTIRILNEMKYAALHNEIYHLWFHPHNLSRDYERNLKNLEKILKCFKKMNDEFGMCSMNMIECAIQYDKEIRNNG